METKQCSKCKEIKNINDFYINKKNNDGHFYTCKSCCNKSNRIYCSANKEKIALKEKKRYLENCEKRKKRIKEWKKLNPEKVRKYRKKMYIERFATLRGSLDNRMSLSIRAALKGNKKGRHWETLVEYTLDDLKTHLEKLFQEGMSWDNRNEWHIDHNIPQSAFNFEKAEDDDFKRCWDLKNLQPLWKVDNLKKGDKLNGHFQPKLIFK